MSFRYQKDRGGGWRLIAVLTAFTLFLGVCLIVFYQASTTVEFAQKYYFLVRDCEEDVSSVVATQTYFSGGAGYYAEVDGKGVVVVACYFTRADAEKVREKLLASKCETRLVELAPPSFRKMGKEDAVTSLYSQVDTAHACARILYRTANSLEQGASQKEAVAALTGVCNSLSGLAVDAESKTWSQALLSVSRRGKELAEGIVYAKDLRYLQIELCLEIVAAPSHFA